MSRTELSLWRAQAAGCDGQWLLLSAGEKVKALLPCACSFGPTDTATLCEMGPM